MDFTTDFLLSKDYNTIFVCVEFLTKNTRLIPCFIGEELLAAEQVVFIFFGNMVRYFGISTSVLYVKDPRFTIKFSQSLQILYGLHIIAISTYHSQDNGQTECIVALVKSFEHICLMKNKSTGITIWLS